MGQSHRLHRAPPQDEAPSRLPASPIQTAIHRTYQVAIRPLDFFRASEEVDMDHVHQLVQAIAAHQAWTTPVPVAGDQGIVMDGNHRIRAAALMGLRYLPCVPLQYNDPRVAVLDWSTGQPFCVDTIYRTVMGNQLFPYKTTKHFFDPVLPTTDIPLSLLRG